MDNTQQDAGGQTPDIDKAKQSLATLDCFVLNVASLATLIDAVVLPQCDITELRQLIWMVRTRLHELTSLGEGLPVQALLDLSDYFEAMEAEVPEGATVN